LAEKSRDAFRTISEVADWLDVPTHVLRFWESRFSQIKPVKRAGGRRYYRPSDMRVIGGVKVLLHDQGMTIRGVQKLFREEGVKHVASYAPELFGDDEDETRKPLNEEALAQAARPSGAARSTHGAEPAPLEDAETGTLAADAVDRETVGDAPVMFRRSRQPTEDRPAAPETAEKQVEEAPAPPAPRIPATPDVPETDPEDDAKEHAKEPGAAARLKLAAPAALAAHRDLLASAAKRLRALAERAD
jgi:DNA-binding transcriptional MerR regulator